MTRQRQINQQLFYAGLVALLIPIVVGWWLGSHNTLTIPGARLVMIGRLFGLLAAYCILLQVMLMSRLPLIEENFDLHETVDLHHLNGYAVLIGICGHIIFVVLGYAAPGHTGLWSQFWNLNIGYEDVFKSTIGTVIFFGVMVTSLKILKSKLNYELWYFIHLTVYFAILLTFLHQVKIGGDLTTQRLFLAYWYALYFLVAGIIGYYRFLRPVLYSLKHGFVIDGIEREAENIYSVYVTGKNIKNFKFIPGQYATWRILGSGLWWEGHPFSFSGQPGKDKLRFTIKTNSGYGAKLLSAKSGTPVVVDGPRGSFIVNRAGTQNVVLIAGGIGLTPYASFIDQLLTENKTVTLAYAVRNNGQIAFRKELIDFRSKGLNIELYESDKGTKIDDEALQRFATQNATVFVCGPDMMSRSFTKRLLEFGLPKSRLVTERFAF